jgi:hypothetical protein
VRKPLENKEKRKNIIGHASGIKKADLVAMSSF